MPRPNNTFQKSNIPKSFKKSKGKIERTDFKDQEEEVKRM